jgi:hypothetical protein
MRGGVTLPAAAERVSAPILVPLVVAVALLMVSVTIGVSWIVERENKARIARTMEQTEALFRLQVEEDGEALDIALHGIVHDRRYAQPLQSGDRGRLNELVAPLYAHLRANHRATHFYVTDGDRVTLLRAHDPDLIGDQIDRLTMLQAGRTGEGAFGMELGRLGTLTLRSVMPYRADGRVVGYFELGEEIGHIIDRVHGILGVDLVVLIDKRRVERQGWETGHRLFRWPVAWDRLMNVAMTASTMAELPVPLIQRMAEAGADGDLVAGNVQVDGRTLHIAPLPLRDVAGERVGSLVVVADLTSLVAKSRMLIAGVGVLCLVLGSTLLVLFRRIIGRVEKRVRAAINGLARSNADLERLAYVACHDLQEAVQGLARPAELLRERHRTSLDGDGSQLLDSIVARTLSVREIIETLEDYLDLDINVRREFVALDAVVAAALEKLKKPTVGTAEVTVEPLPVLPARPMLLARAVLRLIEAAQENPIPDCPRRLHIAAAKGDGAWRITFTDNGTGSTVAREEKIAEARDVAEMHGGDVIAASGPEGGRTLTLVLPSRCPCCPPGGHCSRASLPA